MDELRNADEETPDDKPRTGEISLKSRNDKQVKILRPPGEKIPALFWVLSGFFILFVIFMLVLGKKRENSDITIYNFSKGRGSFDSIGHPEGTIKTANCVPGIDPSVKCLKYEYENRVDNFTGVGTLNAPLSGFKEIKMNICSMNPRTFAISVDELDDGAVYVYTFQLEGNKWSDITATPDRFQLSMSSRDDNNCLDIENLNTRLVVADMSGFLGEIGPNTFWISKIEIDRSNNKNPER